MINLINRNGFYVRANTPIPSMDLIIHEVSSISKISVKELRSNSRKGDTVAYRQLIAYIVKNRTNKSLKKNRNLPWRSRSQHYNSLNWCSEKYDLHKRCRVYDQV